MDEITGFLLNLIGFEDGTSDYERKHKPNKLKLMRGSMYSNGIGLEYENNHLKITQYHYLGGYSSHNYSNLFSGSIYNVDDAKTIIRLLKL